MLIEQVICLAVYLLYYLYACYTSCKISKTTRYLLIQHRSISEYETWGWLKEQKQIECSGCILCEKTFLDDDCVT